VPLQWELREQGEKLRELIEQSQVDEKAALAQAGRVSDIEAQIKQMHLALLIRIKNSLDDEQRARLDELKSERRQQWRGGRKGGSTGQGEGPRGDGPGDEDAPPFRD
jgi:Spy/CpxP family protein refolding chaperone